MNIGPYDVLDTIGQGGMGTVYRARDPRLDRIVAIKVLLDDVASDPARRERFLLEARAVAALTHPHIVTIFSVEEDGGRIFLTMEYVDGTRLSDVIPQGGMMLDRLLALAIPLADAIAAAHQKGIVHRDLKPANVMISREGRVKVLDFGLAKLAQVSVSDAASVTRAVPAPITRDGVILGTIAYMAPEQAEGRPVDQRTDIFALGVMLYEMATGRRPFAGETTAALIASIMRDMPAPVTEINGDMPGEFARIVRRCLAKDPTRRYQTALDVRNELEDLQREVESGRPVGARTGALDASSMNPPVKPASSSGLASASGARASTSAEVQASTSAVRTGAVGARRWAKAIGIAVALTLLAVTAIVFWPASRHAPTAAPAPAFADRQVTSNPPEDPVWYASISPDGKYIAYGDFTGIHLRLIDTGETRTIPVPEGICFT